MAHNHLNFDFIFGSQMDMAIEALTNHRDYYFKQMLDEIKNGNYENAHQHYLYFKDMGYMLDQMLLELADVAANNYAAATYKGDAKAQERAIDSDLDRRKDSYKDFLSMIVCATSDETE